MSERVEGALEEEVEEEEERREGGMGKLRRKVNHPPLDYCAIQSRWPQHVQNGSRHAPRGLQDDRQGDLKAENGSAGWPSKNVLNVLRFQVRRTA